MSVKGIDVSIWQGDIDWPRVRKAGIQNVMIRASAWLSEDKKFRAHIEGALAAGLDVGAYHYSYAVNASEAAQEAEYFLNAIRPYRLTLPAAFDFEDQKQMPLSPRESTDIVKTFCDALEKEKYYCVLYTFASWMGSKFIQDEVGRYDKWVAHIEVDKPAYDGAYGIWQYSHRGQVDGISGNVDFNIFYKDYPAIIKAAGLNGFSEAPPEELDYQTLYEQLKIEYDKLKAACQKQ